MTVSTASNDYGLRNSSRIKYETIRNDCSAVSNDYCLRNSSRIKYETIRNDCFYCF